jgi:hypothetical protein
MAAPTSAVQELQKILANGVPSTHGLKTPQKLTPKQEQALAGSVERHIEPRGAKKAKAATEKAPAKKAAPAVKVGTKAATPSKAKSKKLMKFR